MSRRILVVDDDVDSAEVVAMFRGMHGHETREAHSAGDAVQAAIEFRPKVVVLDIGLPGLNGYETAAMIRGTETCSTCRFIALTGYSREEVAAASIAAGFEALLTKPLSAEDLLDIIASSGQENSAAR